MKLKVPKTICIPCGNYVPFVEATRIATMNYRGINIEYLDHIAYCRKCGGQVDAPGLWDKTLKSIQESYLLKKHRRLILQTQPQSKETDN